MTEPFMENMLVASRSLIGADKEGRAKDFHYMEFQCSSKYLLLNKFVPISRRKPSLILNWLVQKDSICSNLASHILLVANLSNQK